MRVACTGFLTRRLFEKKGVKLCVINMYDPKSKAAEDFINHDEIESTLAYAEEHKADRALIEALIHKASQQRPHSPRSRRPLGVRPPGLQPGYF